MTHPVYKIEIRQPDDTLLHTITKNCLNVRYTKTLTGNVGTFSFSLPAKLHSGYKYHDVTVHDKVKIWIDYDSVSGDPDFIGRILRMEGLGSRPTGYLKVFKGRDQGEILQRRIKSSKQYIAINADTIVTELANDLSLGTGDIASDTTDVTLTVEDETYFDLLKRISDYWYDAGTKITKDFRVDEDFDLVWKTRPIRAAGVESFNIANKNVLSYQVIKDVESVRNKIKVYGSADAFIPRDQDTWTESLTDWTASVGSLDLYDVGPKKGTYSVRCYSGTELGEDTTTFKCDIPRRTIEHVDTLSLWRNLGINCNTAKVRLHCPDSSNYFEADLGTNDGWDSEKRFSLGLNAEYDAVTNPNGVWTKTGSPHWWNIEYIQFHAVYANANRYTAVDAMHFVNDRWVNTAEDATSQSDYGIREAVYTDNSLHSDEECESRAESLIFQLKDPPTRINFQVEGNKNVLVGDRVQVTIPAENISSANHDIVSVTQSWSPRPIGFRTTAFMVNLGTLRTLPAASFGEVMIKWKGSERLSGKGIRYIR